MLTGAIAAILLGTVRSPCADGLFGFWHELGKRGERSGGPLCGLVARAFENAPGQLVWLGYDISAFTPATYQRHRL